MDQYYKSIDGASVSPLIVFTQQAKTEQNSNGIAALIEQKFIKGERERYEGEIPPTKK